MSERWRPKIEVWPTNLGDLGLTLVFVKIEDSIMCREPHLVYLATL